VGTTLQALNRFKYCSMTFQEFKNSKIKTNKYLNNDIAKLVLVTVLLGIKSMKAFRGKLFLPTVAVL